MTAMDGERVGPLSYDVSRAEGDPSAQRPIVVGGLMVAGLMALELVGGWFLLGQFEDARRIVNGLPLALILLTVGVAIWTSRPLLRRARRVALAVVLSLSLLGALFTQQALANIEPAVPQVRHTLTTLRLPPGFELISETTRGDRLCRRSGCPGVVRTYSAPQDDEDPVRTLILAMFDQGWERTSTVAPELATTAHRDRVTAHLRDRGPSIVEVTAVRDSS
jgi:hypothetical protein